MRGNRTPRPMVTLQSDERVKVPRWAVEGLGLEAGQKLSVSVWSRQERITLEGDAIVLEVVRDEE